MDEGCDTSFYAPDTDWVFGYGSLIYKVDFPYRRRELASITGWKRRFWQGSHDHREKNGYQRHRVEITLVDADGTVNGMLYVAGTDNPAFLGPANPDEIVEHILGARGPSGNNRDYLLKLDRALREIGGEDSHVAELARRVSALGRSAG